MRLVSTIEGFEVYYDEHSARVARAIGLWPRKRIVVGPDWSKLPEPERVAVLYHEAGHCRAFHLEKRIVALALAAVPAMALVSWTIIAAVILSLMAWELAAWLARQGELEADRFAAARGHGQALARFLSRATNHGASEFYPSHAERIAALASIPKEDSCSNA